MLKIFKNKINRKEKIEEEIKQYSQEVADEFSRIINRPKEGEIVKISNIKIHEHFKKPNEWKIRLRRDYYEEHKYFKAPIVLDNANYLADGYTTYLLAKEMKFDYITILRAR